MPISKDNYIFVYNLDNSDSLELAQYYATQYNMDIESESPSSDIGSTPSGIQWQVSGQILGISCSEDEILGNETEFQIQIIEPIKEALIGSSLKNRVIWGIILGYKVPGGFYVEGDNIVSSTSRVARGCISEPEPSADRGDPSGFNSNYTGVVKNKLYNRSVFQRYNVEDTYHALVVARIDAPTLALAKEFVDNGQKARKQLLVNGTLYVDPYSDRAGSLAREYEEDILSFQSDFLPRLNLETWSTVFIDPYFDVTIPFVTNDCFAWSWFTDRADFTFFQSSTAARTFFYNADYDGAFTVRSETSRRWCILSLMGGYASTAGQMSEIGIDSFLRPLPFFRTLFYGATLGEAYLFSSPYLDNSLAFIGDPLVEVAFPKRVDEIPEDESDNDESWFKMSKEMARVAAYFYQSGQDALTIRNTIVDLTSNDMQPVLDLLYPSQILYSGYQEAQRYSELIKLVSNLFDYPAQQYKISIDNYLTEKEYKVSELLTNIAGSGVISTDNTLDEGWWEFEFIIQDEFFYYVDYGFRVSVYNNSAYTNLIIGPLDSSNLRGWFYEKEKDSFRRIPVSGVPSSYIGRRVRYQSKDSSEYLTRGQTYYFKVMQYDIVVGTNTSWRQSFDIIYT